MNSADLDYVAATTARRPVVFAYPEKRNVLVAFPLRTQKTWMRTWKTWKTLVNMLTQYAQGIS